MSRSPLACLKEIVNRYEALIAQLKADGTTNLKDTWIICFKCLDSWLGKPGDKCCVCDGETKPIPLFNTEENVVAKGV